jgi:hypothetical protein
MRLLVFTPTYDYPDGTPAMAPECGEAIKSQSVNADWEWQIGRHNPHPGASHANVLAQYQEAQRIFFQGDWDALLTVEHDNVLPDSGAIQRLLDTPGDVVYAPYVLRHGVAVLSTWQYCGDKNIGMSLTLHPKELAKARKANIWRICGVGMGCTLFRRQALEAIPFRKGAGDQYAPDIPFATDALRLGLESYGRFDVPVTHRQNDMWLHPYVSIGKRKYYCRVTVNALAEGERFRLVQGEYISMTPSQAYDLARAGFVTIPDEKLWEASGLPPGRDQEDVSRETETATAEPDAERAVLPAAKKRKGKAA